MTFFFEANSIEPNGGKIGNLMDAGRFQNLLMVVSTLFIFSVSSGAACMRRPTLNEFQPPVLFQTPPTPMQLADAINRSRAIQQLQSNAVTIRMANMPALTSTLEWQRPRNFRVIGGLSRLTGTDFDLGSNDSFFWMASRHGPTPTLYYASHEQFDRQLQRQILPVSPLWLIEAMGIIELDPYQLTAPPQVRADGMLELQTLVQSPAGTYTRSIIIEPKYGYVKQIVLFDPTQRMLASSTMSKHQYYGSVQYSLPHFIQIQLVPVGGPPLDLTLDVGYYAINSGESIDPNRFAVPDDRGFYKQDLVELNQGGGGLIPPGSSSPPPVAPSIPYRGFP